MALKLNAAIEAAFDWSDHVDNTPTLDSRKLDEQRKLAAAYLRDFPSDFHELFCYLGEHENNTVAAIIDGSIDPDARREFDDALADAAIEAYRDGIEDRILAMFDRYCRDVGVYDADSDHEPGALRGFNEAA